MIYGYIRVSTDKQTVENQRFEVLNYCKAKNLKIDHWIEETISSTAQLDKRKLWKLMQKLSKGDLMIASEISRLGRNLMQIMSILNFLMDKEVLVHTIKDNYELGNNISSKVLAFAFGLSAEIERNLISQRVTEALARLKAEGRVLGRPIGSKKKNLLLAIHSDFIKKRVEAGATQISIARKLKCHRHTVKAFIENLQGASKASQT